MVCGEIVATLRDSRRDGVLTILLVEDEMKSFPIIATALAAAILFLAVTSPQQSSLSADDIKEKKAEIAHVETMLAGIVDAMDSQRNLSDSTREQVDALADAVKLISESMIDRKSVVKLVSDTVAEQPKPKAEIDGCDCNCADKLADLQKQIDELKAKVTALEAKPAYQAASYGSSTAAPVKSGGSTGSVKSGGSTGSVAASGGSTGSVKAAKYGKIIVYTTPGCQLCPAAIAQVQNDYSSSWEVEVVEEQGTGKFYPYYRVCYGDQCSDEIRSGLNELNGVITARLVSMGVPLTSSTIMVSESALLASEAPRRTPLRNAVKAAASVPTRAVGSAMARAGNVLHQWGNGRAAEVALASAQYRASNRIKGHSQVDLSSGMSNGVGWSTSNPQPKTCFWNRRSQGAYASVQGSDGYYGTLVLY